MHAEPLPIGKLPPQLLGRLLDSLFWSQPEDVLIGPAVGEDACVLAWEGGDLVVATDPITLTGAGGGRHAVIVNANDVAVTGARPRWFLATVLLPPGSTEEEFEQLFGDVRRSLSEVGATLVGGHSEVTSAVTQPVVVGQMLGLVERGRAVATGGASPGDVLLQVGPVPVEGAALLARDVQAAGSLGLERSVVEAAAGGIDDPGISVVTAALIAAKLGATALHDPTEGGLAAALHEMAAAAGLRLRLERDRVMWFGPGVAVCRALRADPWATLASGALLAAFRPAVAERAAEVLRAQGLEVAAIARAERGSGVEDAAGVALPWPERDELSRLIEDR